MKLRDYHLIQVIVPPGVRNILLDIPVCYLPSGETQEFYCKLLQTNKVLYNSVSKVLSNELTNIGKI